MVCESDHLQATLLRYTLPAMACAPPLLLSLIRQSSAQGVLLTCHILVSPSMPGSLETVTVDLHIPSSPHTPLKVPPGGSPPCPACKALQLADCQFSRPKLPKVGHALAGALLTSCDLSSQSHWHT